MITVRCFKSMINLCQEIGYFLSNACSFIRSEMLVLQYTLDWWKINVIFSCVHLCYQSKSSTMLSVGLSQIPGIQHQNSQNQLIVQPYSLTSIPHPIMRRRVSAGVQVSSTIVVSGRAKIRDSLTNSSLQGFGTGSGSITC